MCLVTGVLYNPQTGALGCNGCGLKKIFHHHRPVVAWMLCKECKKVVDLAGPLCEKEPNQYSSFFNRRFVKPACNDLTGPHGVRTLPLEQHYWDDWGERLPQFRNTYHLLDSVPPPSLLEIDRHSSSNSEFSSDEDADIIPRQYLPSRNAAVVMGARSPFANGVAALTGSGRSTFNIDFRGVSSRPVSAAANRDVNLTLQRIANARNDQRTQ